MTPISPIDHGWLMSCRGWILDALREQMSKRAQTEDWVEAERLTVAVAANLWAEAHGVDQRVTIEDVKRIETRALGHVDYATKLSLYIAEFVAMPSGRSGEDA